jgi:hypothetical protein
VADQKVGFPVQPFVVGFYRGGGPHRVGVRTVAETRSRLKSTNVADCLKYQRPPKFEGTYDARHRLVARYIERSCYLGNKGKSINRTKAAPRGESSLHVIDFIFHNPPAKPPAHYCSVVPEVVTSKVSRLGAVQSFSPSLELWIYLP